MKFKKGDLVRKVTGTLSPYIGHVTSADSYIIGGIVTKNLRTAHDHHSEGDTFGGRPDEYILEKSTKRFKKGDKVAVYDSRLVGTRQVGTLASLKDPNGFMKSAFYVKNVKRTDGYDEIIVHPKQVRKIKESK